MRVISPSSALFKMLRAINNSANKVLLRVASRILRPIGLELVRTHSIVDQNLYDFTQSTDLLEIRKRTLNYVASMRIVRDGQFIGYRHSASTTVPVLYDTLAALLIKHLYGAQDDFCKEEVQYVLRFQDEDGLFRDPVIACPQAESEDWWGWRHLTLHALMVLGLYNTPAHKEIRYLDRFKNNTFFRQFLDSLDWGKRAAWTSNAVQNIGVMLQYSRDYHKSSQAEKLLDVLFEVLDKRQDPETGLYGVRFETPEEISNGVQAGYHFWLLYFYDGRPIHHKERIVDFILKTQNVLGGYGVKWNSSACEDIDSVDPLVRFSRIMDYRHEDIQASLRRALAAILHNLNSDGGWVFRRHEPFTYGFSTAMFSAANESNLFFTWFRTLGLAYCLEGIDNLPSQFRYRWHWGLAPGHQFITSKTT
jgi:hypothetical protein